MKSTLIAMALVCGGTASATVLSPTHYNMLNGYGVASGGSYNYWDASYNGSGNTQQDFAQLAGGLGDLSDGVIATQRWDQVENLAGTGPYVGWRDIDPVIQFHFGGAVLVTRITVHHDDANGYGNVATPGRMALEVGDRTVNFSIDDPAGDAPFATVLNLAEAVWSDRLSLQIFRRDTAVMISEIQFEGRSGQPVPEPASGGLALAALAALAALSARRPRPAR